MQEFEIEQIKEIIKQHGYEYKEILKNDSFSYIFLCHHRSNGQKFVIKMSIKQQIVEDESKNLMELCHPYIIKLYDIFEDDVNEYLVLEYCPNGTIEQKGKLPYKKFVRYSKQILEAIKFCHSKNIALRDINPKNIYIDQYDQVKLTNFGMAKEFQNDETSNEKCSSLMFLAPELFLNKDVCPFKTDIWALGVTFFYMATGSFPFKSSSIEKTKQMIERGDVNYSKYEMHPQIRFLISRMLAVNKNQRLSADKLLELPLFTANKLPLLNLSKKTNCSALSDEIRMHRINNSARCQTCRRTTFLPKIQRVAKLKRFN